MAENESPEGLATKWFLLTAVGAFIYVSVVFAFVIHGNDDLLESAHDAKAEHHD